MAAIPSTTGNVGDLLSHQFATQKRNNQQALLQILSSIKFLCRQGLPLRGEFENEKQYEHTRGIQLTRHGWCHRLNDSSQVSIRKLHTIPKKHRQQ